MLKMLVAAFSRAGKAGEKDHNPEETALDAVERQKDAALAEGIRERLDRMSPGARSSLIDDLAASKRPGILTRVKAELLS